MLPLIFIPIRYLMVAGLWGLVSLSSPFCMTLAKSFLEVGLEYAVILERIAPSYLDKAIRNIEMV